MKAEKAVVSVDKDGAVLQVRRLKRNSERRTCYIPVGKYRQLVTGGDSLSAWNLPVNQKRKMNRMSKKRQKMCTADGRIKHSVSACVAFPSEIILYL